MAKAADHFRAADVTFWGLAAIGAWALAVLAANVSAIIPEDILASLHSSRLSGGTVNQVRAEILDLQQEAAQLRRENQLLLQRFDLAERARAEVTQRVGALETSVPRLLERIAEQRVADGSVTASAVDRADLSFEAEGGSVRVRQRPLVSTPGVAQGPSPTNSAMPLPLAEAGEFGVALGFPVETEEAPGQWQTMLANVGTLLIGLWPMTGPAPGADGNVIIAGPITDRVAAEVLCERLDRVGVPCEPVPFAGEPLPLLN